VVRPACYRTRIAHGRTERVGHAFAYRHPMWLVDLDAVPVLPRGLRILGSFDPVDHLGDPASSLRANVDRFLGLHGLDVAGGQVLMLTNARSFGYAFNPLSVFWCYDGEGALVAVVAEVHNTYGERHCYLVRPDARGRGEADKAFYVSPFFAVDGRYEMTFTDPRGTDELRVEITLWRANRAVFRATLRGVEERRGSSFLVASLRHPLASQRVTALIRLQGTRLWLRRLPVVPRPPAPVQQGV
jgi:uncharacterized protein